MLHLAHTRRYHWGNVGSTKEISIGEWQCSHVYALLKMGPAAFIHAKVALALAEPLPRPNFLIASATQALAHAQFLLGDIEEANRNKLEALRLLEGVNEPDAVHIRHQIMAMLF